MGRYDKIQVYNGGWTKIKRIKVYHAGSWKDLGEDDSTNTTDLKVRKGTEFVRATLNKKVETVPDGDKCTYVCCGITQWSSHYSGYDYQGDFCWNPNGRTCRVKCTVRKDDNADRLVFYSGDFDSYDNMFSIVWLADGRFEVRGVHNSIKRAFWSSNKVYAGEWADIEVRQDGSSATKITVNGVPTSMYVKLGKNYYTTIPAFAGVNKIQQIGDDNVSFKDKFILDLVTYGPREKNLSCYLETNFSQKQTSAWHTSTKNAKVNIPLYSDDSDTSVLIDLKSYSKIFNYYEPTKEEVSWV